MSNERNEKPVRETGAQDRENEISAWATAGVAAMLGRVRAVCITELQWQIDELRAQ